MVFEPIEDYETPCTSEWFVGVLVVGVGGEVGRHCRVVPELPRVRYTAWLGLYRMVRKKIIFFLYRVSNEKNRLSKLKTIPLLLIYNTFSNRASFLRNGVI